ncbi:MAG: molybdopterin-synthase adenylyltransferase MoeB [Verrucomicrobiae bacterium]|nr:molybdopterin-synthase adenylyltransferase MoeB [Verrucomicrobiae bacterium]
MPSPSTFSTEETERYARHFLLPQVGQAGQERLKKSSVLLIGLGGLGSPAATYLAAAGVGRLGLVDPDVVDLSNLQRQILYTTPETGKSKTEAAAARLRALNPHVKLDVIPQRFTAKNAMKIARPYDVLVDGTDNFPTRYLVNDTAFFLGKPNAYGAISRFEGQTSFFKPGKETACYRCIFPEPPPPERAPSCADAGVLGVVPGLIGLIQATETLKAIMGLGSSLANRLLIYDALAMKFREMTLRRNPECPLCGNRPAITRLQHLRGGFNAWKKRDHST